MSVKYLKITMFLLMFVVIGTFGCNKSNEYNDDYWSCEQLIDTYGLELYPFVPFTDEEWRAMSYDYKVERRQIPQDYLHKMTTKELLYQYANTDLSQSIFLFNSLYFGFRASINQFNMLPELLNRPDAGKVIVEILKKVDITRIEKDCYQWYCFLQMIAAQPEIINGMTDADIDKYIFYQKRCHDAIQELSTINNERWAYPRSAELILIGFCNVMIRYEFKPFKQLLELNPNCEYCVSYDLIIDCIEKFIIRKK